VHQGFDERQTGSREFGFLKILRRHFADDFIEGSFGDSLEIAAEKNFARAHGFGGRVLAVDQIGDGFGQRFVRLARAWIGGMLLFESRDFVAGEEGEIFQVADDVAVVGVDPILIKLVDAGPFRIEPDGAGYGLADFGAVRTQDQRKVRP
jgi:hypothetical protein